MYSRQLFGSALLFTGTLQPCYRKSDTFDFFRALITRHNPNRIFIAGSTQVACYSNPDASSQYADAICFRSVLSFVNTSQQTRTATVDLLVSIPRKSAKRSESYFLSTFLRFDCLELVVVFLWLTDSLAAVLSFFISIPPFCVIVSCCVNHLLMTQKETFTAAASRTFMCPQTHQTIININNSINSDVLFPLTTNACNKTLW